MQESLTNVHRHAAASDASVHFQHKAEVVTLEIKDFGNGISQERLRLLQGASAETGVGLAGMRERVRELNGVLEVESDILGTRVRATVPLNMNAVTSRFGDRDRPAASATAQ
jgi:signal transduction histidine kinase